MQPLANIYIFIQGDPIHTYKHTQNMCVCIYMYLHLLIYMYKYVFFGWWDCFLGRWTCLLKRKDIDTWLTKAWTAIDKLSVIWKSDLIDKMKCSFFQAVVVSILLYGCTTWMLTKRLEKKLDGNYTRMLRAILNKSWR